MSQDRRYHLHTPQLVRANNHLKILSGMAPSTLRNLRMDKNLVPLDGEFILHNDGAHIVLGHLLRHQGTDQWGIRYFDGGNRFTIFLTEEVITLTWDVDLDMAVLYV